MAHCKRILVDCNYRLYWLYNIMIAGSQFLYVVFYGGTADQTLSGEIGRRLSQSRPLDPFLYFVKLCGDRTIGRDHWWHSMERDIHYQSVRIERGHGYPRR